MSLRDQFLEAAGVPHEDREVNGVTVRVRGLTAGMQLKLANATAPDAADLTFWVLENCLVDPETGDRLFGDDDPVVRDMSGDVLAELAQVAMRLSGVSEAAKN